MDREGFERGPLRRRLQIESLQTKQRGFKSWNERKFPTSLSPPKSSLMIDWKTEFELFFFVTEMQLIVLFVAKLNLKKS